MIYIFAIIFSFIQCNIVKYNINIYHTKGYVYYTINNTEKIWISSFNEYLYLKTVELDVSKRYNIVIYCNTNSSNLINWSGEVLITTSKELMQLEEYYNIKKNNNNFDIMFCPNGSYVDRTGKIFFEFLKNNKIPKILITSNNNISVQDLGEIKIYNSYETIHFIRNEFIYILGDYDYFLDYYGYKIEYTQLYYIEKNMMFYIYYIFKEYGFKTVDTFNQAEFTKSILDIVKKTEDNREQFKSIPKEFIIVANYKFDSISKSIFVKAGFSYSFLDSENYYPIFFKTSENFQPIKTEDKEYNSTNFVSITTFGENNLEITK